MHQYDVASKVLMETCRDELIRYFTGIDVAESTQIEELPQETVSLKRSDFPIMVTGRDGVKQLLLIELQSQWHDRVSLHLLDHRTRYQIKFEIDPKTFVILLKPSGTAVNVYENSEVRFTFRLIKIYKMDARELVDTGPVCLLPLVPLMKGGRDLLTEADDIIYRSERTRTEKADMLTSMAILSGLVSKDLPVELINRRKDIMIESTAYDIIKQDGIAEGMVLDARKMLMAAIEARFGQVPEDITKMVEGIADRNILELLLKQAVTCQDMDVLRNKMAMTGKSYG